MKRTIVLAGIAAAVLALGLGLVAHAQEPEPAAAAGTLTAQGDGFVGLQARGTVEIQGQGSGIIWVHEGTVDTEGQGERFDLPRGGVLLVSWNGQVTVSGERVGVRLVSHSVDLSATGAGLAVLYGKGTYQTESESGEWALPGVRVRFGLPKVFEGTGTLSASGSGEALVRGKGRVEIQSHGEGVVRIRGAARVTVDGKEQAESQAATGLRPRRKAAGRPIILRDVEGVIVAEGERFEVGMRSSQIEFKAQGTGVVGLRGQGTYEIGRQKGEWSETGLRIRIRPE